MAQAPLKATILENGAKAVMRLFLQWQLTSFAWNDNSREHQSWRRRLHSGVHRRQSILPTQKENLWRPQPCEYTRPASAVSSPSQETDPSESISCNRLRRPRTGNRVNTRFTSMLLRHFLRKCPSALSS